MQSMYKMGLLKILSLILIVCLAGCGGAKLSVSGDELKVKTDDGELNIAGNDKDGTFKYAATDGNGGSFKIEGGAKTVPEGFPKEIPIPKGAVIENAVSTSSAQGASYSVSYNLSMSAKDVSTLYKDALNKLGYTINEMSSDGNISLICNKDKENIFIECDPDEKDSGKAQVSISYAKTTQ
jgi:ABC-type Fe3+-citrate transport system substrate-binding protein